MPPALAAVLVAGLAAPGLSLAVAASATAQEDVVMRSADHDYRVVTVADGLVNPWSMAFLPGGDILVTERPGRLRIIRDGALLPDPVPGVPEVVAVGQGGLMEVAAHPDFASNRLIYMSYTKRPQARDHSQIHLYVVRGTFENDHFAPVEEVFEAVPHDVGALLAWACKRGWPWGCGGFRIGTGHIGCRLAFDANGYLFLTVGDRQSPLRGDLAAHPAQDVSNHLGVVVRIHDDGRVPTDNPFVDQEGARPETWSYGHRNPQGLAIHPETGAVWLTEHGPQGGDEVNVSEPGKNYGWPVIGYGVNYHSGSAIHAATHADGMEQPLHVWVPSIGTSGLMFYTGDKFPAWQGSLFAGGLVGQRIDRLSVEGNRVVASETLLRGMGRVRDIRQGPDGFIYVALESYQGNGTPIVRLEPVGS